MTRRAVGAGTAVRAIAERRSLRIPGSGDLDHGGHGARRRMVGVALATAAVVVAGASWHSRTVPLRWLGSALVHEDGLARADVAVVSMATAREAALDAAKLYHRGVVSEIWIPRWRDDVVDRRLDTLGVRVPRPHEVARTVLEHARVPPVAIADLAESVAGLEDEAAVVGRALRGRPGLRVLVLTARSHTARARLLLRDVFAPAADVRVRAARADRFSTDAWWRTRGSVREVALESLKWLFLLMNGPTTRV